MFSVRFYSYLNTSEGERKMITIKGSIKFIMSQLDRFKLSHKISRFVRVNGEWQMTLICREQ